MQKRLDQPGWKSYIHIMDYQEMANLFKALSNPSRLEILEMLEHHGCNVTKMVENLNIPQSTVSQHLGVLRKYDIVVTKKEGYCTCYQIKDWRIKEILRLLKGH
ncbi:MAG: winged helix-turn-helix transcriptional regulator [Spirochaetales bacterium]|nr:winged helix-turn-helix transcriptional regulator [Spirochaetales bacterium]